MFVNVYENDATICAKWSYHCHQSSNIQLLSRQLKATKVLCMSGRVFSFKLYDLRRRVKPRYFYETLYNNCVVIRPSSGVE